MAFESDDYQTVQGLVGAGVGVALIPELALAHVRADIAIREISPRSPVRRVTVATPTDALTPAADAMLAILEEAAVTYAGQRGARISSERWLPPAAAAAARVMRRAAARPRSPEPLAAGALRPDAASRGTGGRRQGSPRGARCAPANA